MLEKPWVSVEPSLLAIYPQFQAFSDAGPEYHAEQIDYPTEAFKFPLPTKS